MKKDQGTNYFKFKRDIGILSVNIIPFGLLALACFGYITIPAIIKLLTNDQSISSGEVFRVAFITILVFGEEFYLCNKLFSESSIEFSEIAIRKRGIIKTTIIKWTDIVSIYRIGPVITFQSTANKLKINLYYFKRPDILVDYIGNHYVKSKDLHNS